MRKEEVKNYTITTDGPSGLEFELHLMPQFFNSAVCLEQSSHTHTYYQIIWFRRGYGIHQVDFVDYPVDDNTLFFIAPGQVHSFHGSRDCEGVIIRFNASFMADEQSSESIFLKYDIFNAYDSLPYYKITDAESDHLYILVQAMRIELSLKSAFTHKDYMQYLVRLFLIRVQRAGTRRAVQKLSVSCVAHRSFVRFRQLLEKHFREIHTVKEYADMLHVSTRTLSHYVAQSAHLTPLQVINDRIVLEAKRQLQHSTLSIKEIGYQLGFDDPSYFVKFFKRMTGQMPKEFRKDCEVQQRLSASVSSSKITNIMKQKIGIPTADGKLFPHFGKAPHVTVFDVEDEKILNKEVLTAPEHAHGAMPKFLQGLGVTDVICGGLGAGAIQLLEQMAIRIHGGAPADDVDAVVDAYLKGTLVLGDRTCHHDGCGGDHHHHH